MTGRDASSTGVHADHQPTSTALGTTSTLVSSPSVLRIDAAAAALTAVHRTGQVSHPAIAPMIRTQPSRPVQRECTVATTGTPRPAAAWATRVENGQATERWRCTTSYDVSWRPRGRIGNGTGDHEGARITSTGPVASAPPESRAGVSTVTSWPAAVCRTASSSTNISIPPTLGR